MLNDTDIRKIKPTERPQKLYDSGGLYLYVTPAGSRIWRMKYRYEGREKLLVIGHYPRWSLKRARDARDEVRDLLRDGQDPAKAREEVRLQQAKRSASTFDVIAREWFEIQKSRWTPVHADQTAPS